MKTTDAFASVFDRGFGKECMYVPLDYDFNGSGNILATTLSVYIETYPEGKREIILLLVHGHQGVASLFQTNQQNVSRWIKRHLVVQKQIREKGSIRHVVMPREGRK